MLITISAALLFGSCTLTPLGINARFQKVPSAPPHDDPRLLLDPTEENSFGLTYWIEVNDASGAPAEKASDQRVFKSGDRIRLHFKATANGTVSIIQIAADGTSTVLFPNAARHLSDDILLAGVERPLPSEKSWFKFDENAGTETLLVLFARNRAELDRRFPTRPEMDARTTAILIETAKSASGSKGLTLDPDEAESTLSNSTGAPLIMAINLKHQ
ncbi:MAG: DUF4384 domain-containing protein [Thermoanaerobaculia bacterium]